MEALALELPIDEVGQMRQQVRVLEGVRDQQRATITDLEEQQQVLRQRLSVAQRKHEYIGEAVRDLARVYGDVKRGDKDDALYALEKVLGMLDSGWRQFA